MNAHEVMMWQKIHQLESELRDKKMSHLAGKNPAQVRKRKRMVAKLGRRLVEIGERLQARAGEPPTPVCDH